MADTILLKGGKKANMPTLQDREMGVVKDEKALYVGINGVNVRMCGADDKIAALDEIPADSALSAVVTAHNSLIAALKASGLMK